MKVKKLRKALKKLNSREVEFVDCRLEGIGNPLNSNFVLSVQLDIAVKEIDFENINEVFKLEKGPIDVNRK